VAVHELQKLDLLGRYSEKTLRFFEILVDFLRSFNRDSLVEETNR